MSEINKPWLSIYPKQIPATLNYPSDRTLADYLHKASVELPNSVAIRYFGKSISYKELYESVVACANMLRELGVKKGDRVSIMLPNIPQAVISYYGVLMAGGIVVQTNPLYMERELEHQLNDSGAETIIALDLVYPKVAKVKSTTPLKNVIITGIKDYLPFPKNLLYPFVQKKQGIKVEVKYGNDILSFSHLLSKASRKRVEVEVDLEDTAVLQYTGGTTGLPKGVVLTHRNLVVNAHQCRTWFYKAEYGKEKSLAVVPFFHVYGMTVVMNFSVMSAASMILLPKFNVSDTLKAIDKEKPTLFAGAPTIYIGLLSYPEIHKYDLSSIKACLSGSAPLPVEVQQKFEELTKGKLVEGYGLTETSPVTHANLIWDGEKVRGSIGVPWPDTESVILSLETGEPVGVGEIGEIAVRGPQVMKGYWNRPEETAKTFKDDWFLTGDMGYMDERGYFYIVDRKKDMIIAGGFNIYPREVEEVLYEHPAIQECVVAGVPDPYRGETVKAYIVFKENQSATEKDLDTFCRQKLAAYKVPRLYEFRPELPKTSVGKILRRVLVEEEKQKQTQNENVEQSGS